MLIATVCVVVFPRDDTEPVVARNGSDRGPLSFFWSGIRLLSGIPTSNDDSSEAFAKQLPVPHRRHLLRRLSSREDFELCIPP